MAKRLGKFELPNRLIKEEESSTDVYAKFIAEPFESGYGHTIGNAFRRVLLSSIEGAAISTAMIPFLLLAIMFSWFGMQRRKWQQGTEDS